MKKEFHSKGTYVRLLCYLKPYWRRVIVILLLSIISAFVAVLPIQILGIAVDEIRMADRHANSSVSPAQKANTPGDEPALKKKYSIPMAKPLLKMSGYIHNHWFLEHNAIMVTLVFLASGFLVLHAISSCISLAHGYITSELGQRVVFDMRG